MKILGFESSAKSASVALCDGSRLIAQSFQNSGLTHSRTLLPMAEDLLKNLELTVSDLDLIAVAHGPGSFTGVRIGVSLVNALAFATGRKIVPVDALRTLAQSAGEEQRPVCAMIDARNGNAYAALYQAGREMIAPCAVETIAFVSGLPEDTIYVGDAHAANASYPRAKEVGLVALQRLDAAQDEVEPIYLRASQAERMRQNPSKEG